MGYDVMPYMKTLADHSACVRACGCIFIFQEADGLLKEIKETLARRQVYMHTHASFFYNYLTIDSPASACVLTTYIIVHMVVMRLQASPPSTTLGRILLPWSESVSYSKQGSIGDRC